jgi:hypothetical protein
VADHDDLSNALRKARLAEAAHFEAVLGIRDSKSLRLQALKDDLSPVIAATAGADRIFDLALVPGEPPRLWIDLISSVVMEPDFRTYRLIEDGQSARETLFETTNREEMLNFIKSYMAHRLVAWERLNATAKGLAPRPVGYSTGAVIYAWLSGFMLGLLVLLAAAISLGKFRF